MTDMTASTDSSPLKRASSPRTRKVLVALGLLALAAFATVVTQSSQVQLTTSSNPAGIVSGSAYHDVGSTVSVPAAAVNSNSYRFAYWKLNGVRQTDPLGISVNAFNFKILENSQVVAEYQLESADTDADQVPDWYELRQYGDLNQSPGSDTDEDGLTLLQEYEKGSQPRIPDSAEDGGIVDGGISRRRGEKIAVLVGANWFFYSEASNPPGVVSRNEYLQAGTRVTTANLSGEHLGHRFAQWKVNGVRQESDTGIALSQVNLTIEAATTAVAEYVPTVQDIDADNIPDWYEINQYGTAEIAATSDTDGDGRNFLEEYIQGTQPRISDSASDGSALDGGISRRRGEKMSLAFSENYVRYMEMSQPGGVVSRDSWLTVGSSVSTANAPTDSNGYKFGQWLLNGVRQESAAGIAQSLVTFSLNAATTAVAQYYPATQDLDADQIPDWYEYQQYGVVSNGADSDTDEDGVDFLSEYQRGTQPRIFDSAADGGIVDGGISRRRGEKMVLNLQFFPAGQVLSGDGQGIFSDPYGNGEGSFVINGGLSAPALGDVDGDGDLDMVVGGAGGAVRFLINRGSSFAPLYEEVAWSALNDWPLGAIYPALADWSGDGRADLAVGSDDGLLRFYRAQSGGGFAYVGRLAVGSGAVYPAFLPAAGGPDLLVLQGSSGAVSRFARGSGELPYGSAAETNFLGEPVLAGRSLSVLDTDGDGLLDVIAADADGRMWLFLGRPGGTFFLKSKVYSGSFNGFRAGLSSAVADFDGDGDEDVIGGGSDGRLVYLRNPARHLRVTPPIATVGVGESIAYSSIDNDSTLTWSMGVSRSGGTVVGATGVYTAGSRAGVDQVVVRNAIGRNGVAWINVIERGGGDGKKWQALLVDGRRGPNDPVWPAANALNTRAKEVLKFRGLAETDIRWLGHGSSADGKPTRAALQATLTQEASWAAETDVLLVYMVDHGRVSGSDGLFLLSESESVSGAELDAWLDTLQSARPGLSVVVVVESCFGRRVTGSMAAADAFSSRRLVLSSSGPAELAHLAANGLVSYSTMWWSAVAAGKSLRVAHEEAVAAMNALQTPGISSNGAALAEGNLGSDHVSGSGRPVVTPVGGNISLQGTQEATLAVSVESSFGIERVWGVIVPPNYSPSGDDPVVDLPEVALTKDPATGQWTSTVGGFSEGGAPYTVLLQARDVWGQVSAPALLRVEQAGVRNRVIVFAPGEESWRGAAVAGSLAEYAREAALLRRVRPEDIRVYADEALGVDAALPATTTNLQQAIETWADADGKLGALTLYLVGQGAQDGLVCASGDTVTPQDLKQWLDNLQEGNGATVQVIADADYSGRFVAGAGSATHRRIMVSSTTANQRNTFATGQWSNVTRWIWNSIARGRDLRESYGEAIDLARMIGGAVPALFDDNGDGNFTKLRDGLKAINAFVGSAYVTADDPPFIGKASAMMQVASDQAARFWVSNILMPDGADPQSVWCEIMGPDGTSRGGKQLWHNPTKDRHEGSFSAFTEPGRYLIFVQAGTQGDPSRTTPPAVILVDYANTPNHGAPLTTGLPALTLPLDGRTMDVESDAGGEWRLPLLRGQRVTVEAREVSTGRDVGIQLLGNNGQVLAAADVWGNGFGEIIDGWEAPVDGTYLVRASFASGSGAAECKVRAFIKREAGADSLVPLSGQNITFSPPATSPLNGGPLSLLATATSGLPVRFEIVSGPASLSGNALTPTAAGTVFIRALQDGDATWESAEPIERTMTITSTDSQTYEAWAQEIFGADSATKGRATQDADGDGQTNEVEWRAKTHPRNAADRFEIATSTRTASGFKIRWQAREGVNYRIMVSTDLSSWAELPNSRVTGAGAEVERSDPAATAPRKFYRVEVVQP
jgi:hypothetical protein